MTGVQGTLERVLWDDAKQEMAVVYARHIDGRHDRAREFFRFDEHGCVVAGEAMYGAEGVRGRPEAVWRAKPRQEASPVTSGAIRSSRQALLPRSRRQGQQ